MQNGTAGARQIDETALWRARAEQQARRADRLGEVLRTIAEAVAGVDTREFEMENDDRLFCEHCGRYGWPEDGFHEVWDDEAGHLSFCAAHSEATP